jgi:FixJ family two-component response regulator
VAKILTISIVDDDDSIRESTKGLIRSMGFKADAFSSAEAFLQSSGLCDTACLITDIQMPGMSGVELQNVLLANGHRMPIIFMTAFPEEHIRERVVDAGAVGFLRKPLREGCLINCLETALKSQGGGIVR